MSPHQGANLLHHAHPGPRRDAAWVEARTSSGTAHLRPLLPGETEPLQAVFAAMSPESRRARYLQPIHALTPRMVRALTAVDGRRHVAWLATVRGIPAGIGRYVRVEPGVAEIAFEVADEFQGTGLGAVLLDAVTTVAATSGIRRLQATVLGSNRRSQHLLSRIGLKLRAQDGLLEADGPFHLLQPARVDRAAVLGVAGAVRARAA